MVRKALITKGKKAVILAVFCLSVVFLISIGGSTLGFNLRSAPFAIFVFIGTGVISYCIVGNQAKPPLLLLELTMLCLTVVLVQSVAVPFEWVSNLPGRTLATEIRSIGSAPEYASLTLDLPATLQSGTQLMVFLVALLLSAMATTKQRRWIILSVVGAGLLCLIVSLTQRVSGGSVFDFYGSAHIAFSPGFFANRNHAAIFYACVATLSAGLIVRLTPNPLRRLVCFSAVAILTLTVIIITASRAGLIIGGVMFAAAAWLLLRSTVTEGLGRERKTRLIGAVSAGSAIVIGALLFRFNSAAVNTGGRFGDIDTDLRWSIWTDSLAMIQSYWPFGSGLGTFATQYAVQEKLDQVFPQYINHAHSDWLEILIECGIFAALPAAILAYILVTGVSRLKSLSSENALNAKLGLIVVAGLASHSAVDYPLRTPAIAIIGAIALGFFSRTLLRRPNLQDVSVAA